MSAARPTSRDLSWVPAACAIPLALALIGQALWGISRFWDVFPVGDMIDVLWRYFVGPARDFWIFHDNEHLPLAVMPLYWIDFRVFAARGFFLIACIVVLAAAISLAPIGAVGRALPTRGWLVAAIGCAAVAMQLWLGGYVNLLWTKQVHMYLSLFGVVMAIGVVASPRAPRWFQGAGACAWAALAMFSFGYGINAFPVLLILAAWRRWPWRWLVAIGGVGLFLLVLYIALSAPMLARHGQLFLASRSMGMLALYALSFVASPPYNALRPFLTAPVAFGFAYGLVAAAALGFGGWIWRCRLAPPSELMAWAVGLALVTTLTAAQTALARFFFGFAQAADSRYIVAQMPFWLGVLLLAADALSSHRRRGQALIGTALIASLAVMMLAQQSVLAAMRERNHERYVSAVAALDRVHDPAVDVRDEWYHTDRPPIVVAGLRARGWSVFSWPQSRWIGRGIASFGGAQSGCIGAFDSISSIGNGAGSRAEGWAAESAVAARSPWVLLTDGQGVVRGLAHGGGVRADVTSSLHAPGELNAGWTGYVPPGTDRAGLAAWLLLKGKHPCRLGAPPPAAS